MSEEAKSNNDATAATAKPATPATETSTKTGKQKKVKKIPEGLVIPPKKPKLTKAERRALQEAQRAASTKNKQKQGKQGGGGGNNNKGGGNSGGGKKGGDAKGKEDGSGGSKGNKQDSKKKGSSSAGTSKVSSDKDKTLSFFSHLPSYKEQRELSGIKLGSNAVLPSTSSSQQQQHPLHPAIISLGQSYANGSIRGANARCKAMLQTFQVVIQDFMDQREKDQSTNNNNLSSSIITTKQKDIRQEIEQTILKPAFSYWSSQCRTHSTTMGNAFTFLKLAVASLDRDIDISEMKALLMETMDAYIEERIEFADKVICNHACSKIVDGDVLLVFGHSEVIHRLLITASKEGKKFRVIIVDSRPLLEGRILLQKLLINNEESLDGIKTQDGSSTNAGDDDDSVMNIDGDNRVPKSTDESSQSIDCTYILLNALSYVMKEVTKVFLGAAALMCDGSILSRVGTASIALMAKSQHIPVLVCCETYKINNRVQLESITHNELGNPDDLITNKCALGTSSGDTDCNNNNGSSGSNRVLNGWRETPNLKLLNLLYDLTPSEFVSGIVTEMGILPPTSVAVLLREMNPQDNGSSFNSESDI